MCDCNQTKAFVGQAQEERVVRTKPLLLNKIEDVGELRSKINLLEDSIHYLSDQRDRLGAKLQPILAIKPEAGLKGTATSPSMTDLGGRLQQSIDRIREIASGLDSLREDASI